MTRGKFITLEGGEGAGKSTQAKKLGERLREKGLDVVLTREVGGCPTAESIRNLWLEKAEGVWDPLTELLLVTAARREHLVKTVWPALDRGAWVISDRFADSTRAYQGIGLGLTLKTVDEAYHLIAKDFMPDLTLLLDLSVDKGFARVAARACMDDRYQQKDSAFHQKLRDTYQAFAQTEGDRFQIVDAAQDVDAVAKDLWHVVQTRFFV